LCNIPKWTEDGIWCLFSRIPRWFYLHSHFDTIEILAMNLATELGFPHQRNHWFKKIYQWIRINSSRMLWYIINSSKFSASDCKDASYRVSHSLVRASIFKASSHVLNSITSCICHLIVEEMTYSITLLPLSRSFTLEFVRMQRVWKNVKWVTGILQKLHFVP